jgi:hypothetical protein
MGQTKYEVLAALRGEQLISALAAQRRAVVLTMAGPITAIGAFALALARACLTERDRIPNPRMRG